MNWTDKELNTMDYEDSLFIYIRDENGNMHQPTYIWGVSVNGNSYARGANGVDYKWYKAAIRERKAHIKIGNIEKHVVLTFPNDLLTRREIDQAYKNKYISYIELMTSDKTAAATVKMAPIE
ncbi:DUF2255 family protein [Leuconostoc citreum]|uniref:DUF2255 family protein n=1 Tax=Leuconostoc citreum TaxID=33964 RepID=UPI0032DF24DD